MSKFGRKLKNPPAGFDSVEPILTALENELRQKVNEPHEGLRKNESQFPIHQINWQKTRYIYDMYYTYERISKEVYDYCVNNKFVDVALIAKWKKPGYERLCSCYVINPKNYKFGTVSICRVPKQFLAEGTIVEDPVTGCRGCASGSSHNIFGNKYGQYLAAIQIAREEKMARKRARDLEEQEQREREQEQLQLQQLNNPVSRNFEENSDDERDEEEEDRKAADQQKKQEKVKRAKQQQMLESNFWGDEEAEAEVALTEDMIGRVAGEARQEAMAALAKQQKYQVNEDDQQPNKKSRTK